MQDLDTKWILHLAKFRWGKSPQKCIYTVYQPRRRPNIVQSLVDFRRLCSNEAKTWNPLKFAGVPQTPEPIQLLVDRSSAYCENMCRRYCCLWPPYGIGQAIIFLPCAFFYLSSSSFLFLAESRPLQIGCIPYFHAWHGLSANLRCRSETCCTWVADNTGCKKIAKNSPSGHHRTTLSGYICATKARIDNQKKKLVKQQYLPNMSLQYGELRPTSSWLFR